VLFNGITSPGVHFVKFDAHDLPSGVYIYTITVNGQAESKKMQLLR